MDRSTGARTDKQGAGRRTRRFTAFSAGLGRAELCLPGEVAGMALLSEIRLPPPRTARTARSRGIFLPATEAPKQSPEKRKPRTSIAVLAIAVAAIASALALGAPGAFMWASGNANPGPAIIGAASVPPAFVGTAGVR